MYAVKVYEAYITTRLKEKRIIMNKKYLPGELALCIVLIINSLGVCLMAKSGFGISTISSVPFVFNKVFPALSFGTWNYIFQTMLVLTLMILKKAFCFEYIFSFVVGIGFGKMIDVHDAWLALLPNTMALNVLYFALGFLIIGFGIALANRCMLPIIPTDTFPRDMSEILNKPYKYVKTTFDLCCLSTKLVLCIGILHGLHGVGIGTVLCAFITGKTVSMFQKVLDDHVVFYRAVIRPTKPEISGRTV